MLLSSSNAACCMPLLAEAADGSEPEAGRSDSTLALYWIRTPRRQQASTSLSRTSRALPLAGNSFRVAASLARRRPRSRSILLARNTVVTVGILAIMNFDIVRMAHHADEWVCIKTLLHATDCCTARSADADWQCSKDDRQARTTAGTRAATRRPARRAGPRGTPP